MRDVEAVILLIPMAGAAFDDLDAGPRLGGRPMRHLSLRLISKPSILFSDLTQVRLDLLILGSLR